MITINPLIVILFGFIMFWAGYFEGNGKSATITIKEKKKSRIKKVTYGIKK